MHPEWILKKRQHKRKSSLQKPDPRGVVTLTYFPGISEKIKGCLFKHGIKVIHKPANSIGNRLVNFKDKNDKFHKPGVVYRIPCKNCNLVYIGESKRWFITRKLEHQRDIKNGKSEASALAKHSIELDHVIDWDKSDILHFEVNYHKRRFVESFFINTLNNVMNEKTSVNFPNLYLNVK